MKQAADLLKDKNISAKGHPPVEKGERNAAD